MIPPCSLHLSLPLLFLAPLQHGRVIASCLRDDSLWTVTGLMVASQKHSLMVVTQTGNLEGVVSLTDLLSFITNRSPPTDQRIENLKQHAEESAPSAVLFERDAHELQRQQQEDEDGMTEPLPVSTADDDSGIARDEDFLA